MTETIQIAHDFSIIYFAFAHWMGARRASGGLRAHCARALPFAEERGVTLLVENRCSLCGHGEAAVLFNAVCPATLSRRFGIFYHPYFDHGESPEMSIKNLGAYVKTFTSRSRRRRLLPTRRGTLPMVELMTALSSINNDGFLSLEWDPSGCRSWTIWRVCLRTSPTLCSALGTTAASEHPNAISKPTHKTGTFVWRKDFLIDAKFSQVLDRLAEEYPDSLRLSIRTLDYYAHLRGIPRGRGSAAVASALGAWASAPASHVAVWMTNLPQWYFASGRQPRSARWLVTVNTAYKIHEAEYLLKQKRHAYADSGAWAIGIRTIRRIFASSAPELKDHAPRRNTCTRGDCLF
jgi:fatty-acyl-CoA synthase